MLSIQACRRMDRIVVVNDASKDGTISTVNGYLPEMNERLHLIRHETNQGVGGAIATGYKWCRDHEMDVTTDVGGTVT
ncbi:MAG TPA: glycosyltransferase [Chloroflexi bacterium]|nr:glycosyltransferase [Chloroflexota bacterium]